VSARRCSAPAAALWTNRPDLGTYPSQTRAPNPASVFAEGGGTATPTLGGGFGFSREPRTVGAGGRA